MNPKFITICKTDERVAKTTFNSSQILVLLRKFHKTLKSADNRFAEKFLNFLQ